MGIFDKKNTQSETSAGGSIIHRYRVQVVLNSDRIRGNRPRSAPRPRRGVPTSLRRSQKHLQRWLRLSTYRCNGYYRSSKDGQVCALVTSGMSDLAMNVPAKTNAPRRVELILYCSEPKQEFIDTMRWLAHFPHDQKTWIGAFHTIPNGNPPEPLWGSRVLDTIFLLPPIVKKDADLQDD